MGNEQMLTIVEVQGAREQGRKSIFSSLLRSSGLGKREVKLLPKCFQTAAQERNVVGACPPASLLPRSPLQVTFNQQAILALLSDTLDFV